MIISALARYYDCLAGMEDNTLTPKWRTKTPINYIISLNSDGKIQNIYPHTRKDMSTGKERTVAVEELFPEYEQINAAVAHLIEHRSKYIFGLEIGKKENSGKFVTNKKFFNDCKKKNIEVLDGIDSGLAMAMKKFYENWTPSEETNNKFLLEIKHDFGNSSFAFCLGTKNDALANYDEKILSKFDKLRAIEEKEKEKVKSQCGICGETSVISKTHRPLKANYGVPKSKPSMVCCNSKSSWSYGKEQSKVASVSEKIMKKYTEVMDILSSSSTNKKTFGDMTLLFWAETKKNPNEYVKAVNAFCGDTPNTKLEEATSTLKVCMDYVARGKIPNADTLMLDPNVDFYILGVTQEMTRMAVKLFLHNSFGNILRNIQDHYDNIKVKEDQKIPSIKQILKELTPYKKRNGDESKGKADKKDEGKPKKGAGALAAEIYQSMITGVAYPPELLGKMNERIKKDQDEEKNKYIKINNIRIGVIKMCINRKIKKINKGELITMALNEQSESIGYQCGRLFAVLEAVQTKASGEVGADIKSRFFGAAAATPLMVFPQLINLSQHHMKKIDERRYVIWYDKMITDIMQNIPESGFPQITNAEEQGRFAIGYYHQKDTIYQKKEKN